MSATTTPMAANGGGAWERHRHRTPNAQAAAHQVGDLRGPPRRGPRPRDRPDAVEQPPVAEIHHDGRHVQLELVDPSGGQVLIDCRGAAGDGYVAIAGGARGRATRLLPVRRRPSGRRCRRPSRAVARSTWVSTNTGAWYGGSGPHHPTQSGSHAPRPGTEHVAPHDEGAGRGDRGELGAVLVGVVEHPRVEGVPGLHAVAERLIEGLVGPGGVPVERDREVAGDDAHISRNHAERRN